MAELRPYQQTGIEWLRSRGRGLLADQPGLGKTVQALKACVLGPVLVVTAPNPAIGVWDYETKLWLDRPAHIYQGPKRADALAAFKKEGAKGILVANYHTGREVSDMKWGTIIYDECQALRNRRAATLFKTYKKIRSHELFLLSGTPIINGADDLWTYLHMIDPKKFRGYWSWVHEHFHTYLDEYTERTVVGDLLDPPAFRQHIRPYMLRRLKKDHLQELPPKIRQRVPVTMTKEQQRMYNELAETMIMEIEVENANGEIVLTQNVITQLLRLRQVLVTPALVGGKNQSAGLTAVRELVADELANDRPVIVFTPFAQALPFIADALSGTVERSHIYQVRGGMGSKGYEQISGFQSDPNPHKVMIASVQSAAAWTATEAKTAIFLGAHWTPAAQEQAEDRLHRLGQRDSVRCLYITHEGTVDEHVLDRLDKKTTWAALALDPHLLLHPDRSGNLTKAKFVPEDDAWFDMEDEDE